MAPLFILISILVRAYLFLVGITELLAVSVFCIDIVYVYKIEVLYWKNIQRISI